MRGVEMEREHLTWVGSVVGSAVLRFLERARRRRAASRGVSPNPAPSRLKPLSAGEAQLPNTPAPRAILVDLEHPGSSSILSWCRVCRDGGRDASRSGDAGPRVVVSFGESLARCTSDALFLLALPAQSRRVRVLGFSGPCRPLPAGAGPAALDAA